MIQQISAVKLVTFSFPAQLMNKITNLVPLRLELSSRHVSMPLDCGLAAGCRSQFSFLEFHTHLTPAARLPRPRQSSRLLYF